MTFFDLKFEFQITMVIAILVVLTLMSVQSIWTTRFFKSKFKSNVHVVWPVAVSFFIAAAIIGVGKPEPFEELTLLAIAHLFAWCTVKSEPIGA